MTVTPKPTRDIADLLALMAALRTPVTGCPWDLEQTFATIAPYTIEEAHEVAEAISRNDLLDLRDELGDLLLQVVFHARMAEEQGAFDFGAVVESISAKLIRRHPHVFGDARALAPDVVKALWREIKAAERAARRAERGEAHERAPSVLDGVGAGEPALGRALKLQERAATVGFDWNDPFAVLLKIREELDEIEIELRLDDKTAAAAETGDLMFAVVNLARHLKADPDTTLRAASAKFERRFRTVEGMLRDAGEPAGTVSLERLEAAWVAAKAAERLPDGAVPDAGPDR
jgi:ATP diphosphatase